jgi:hypothetical protein
MRLVTAFVVVCGVLLSATGGSAAASSMKRIYKVDSVAASINGGKLTIMAAGAVSTGGWGKARLRLKPGHKPEANTLVIEFLAAPPPPSVTVIQALVPVTATLTMHLPPYGTEQIEVEAEMNSSIVPIATN